MTQTKDYVLGTDDDELNRLQLQHNLWRDHLIRLFKRAHFDSLNTILELGCGPGFTTGDLAQFSNFKAEITAIDISDKYLNYLDSRKIKNVKTLNSFVDQLNLENKNYDAAFCRWLMIFVPDVTATILKIKDHLRPKAKFVMQEYVAYDTFSFEPSHPIMKKVLDAIFKSWMDQGGNPNQGKNLPQVLEKNGFKVLEIEPIARVCRPNQDLWNWPESFFYTFIPKLVAGKYLDIKDQVEFLTIWESLKKTPGSFCLTPTVVNIIAEKI